MHDQLRHLAKQGDLTSAAIRYAQYAAKSEHRYQPTTFDYIRQVATQQICKVNHTAPKMINNLPSSVI